MTKLPLLPRAEWPQPTARAVAGGGFEVLLPEQLSRLSQRERDGLLYAPAGVGLPPPNFRHAVFCRKGSPQARTYFLETDPGVYDRWPILRKTQEEMRAIHHVRCLSKMASACNNETRASWHHIGKMAGTASRVGHDGVIKDYAVANLLDRKRKKGSQHDQRSELDLALPAFDAFKGLSSPDHTLAKVMLTTGLTCKPRAHERFCADRDSLAAMQCTPPFLLRCLCSNLRGVCVCVCCRPSNWLCRVPGSTRFQASGVCRC